VETLQNSKGLIFNNYSKAEKYLPCYFYYSNSTTHFDLNPVWLDGAFHELSRNIKFVKFGSVDLSPLNFEASIRLQINSTGKFEFKLRGLAGKTNGLQRG
jgi:hypothetical protein